MKTRVLQALIFFCVCLFITSAGMAAGEEKDKNWEFDLAPLYLWGANLSGDMTMKGATAPVDLDFGTIWDNLEGILTVHFEGVHTSGWGFVANLDYLNISADNPAPLGGNLNVDLKETIVELDGFYRTESGPHTYDLLFGLRYTDVDVTAEITNSPTPANNNKGEGNEGWVNGVVGVRYLYQMSGKWNLLVRGDLGLGQSDFTCQGLGIVNFQAWKNVSFFGGYRAIYDDYTTGSGNDQFRYDITMHGPILGINFSW